MAFTDHVKVMLGLDSRGFNDGLNQAETKIQRFARTMQSRFIGSLGTAAIAATTTKIIDFGAAIGDMADRLGVSSTFLQELQFGAEQSGIKAETAAVALQRFTRRVADAQANGGALADTLRNLNISMTDSQGQARTTEDMFRDFGIALTGMENPAERLRIAFQFLDTEGAALTQMFQRGKPSLDDYANSARQLGLILENDTVRALQNASGKLEQAKRQFIIFGAEVFPPLMRFLQNAKIGFDLLTLSIGAVMPAITLLGRQITGELAAKFELMAAMANRAAQEIIHPFRNVPAFGGIFMDEESEQKVLDSIERLKQAQINSARTLHDRKREIFAEDAELAEEAQRMARELNNLQEEFNNVNGRKLITNRQVGQQLDDNLGKGRAIVAEAEKEKNAVDAINGLRQQEEQQLQRTLERIEAMTNGGEDALAVVEQRHDMEDQINRLMKAGNMTLEQAVNLVTRIVQAENQELQIQQKIKAAEEQKVGLKNQAADAQERNIQKLQAENRLNMRGRELEAAKLRILQARAQGRDDEANKLEAQLNIKRQLEGLENNLNLQADQAVRHLERKVNLNNQILQNKNLQQQADLQQAAIQEQALRDVGDAINNNDLARIRAAKSVQRLEEDIRRLQEEGGDRAQREIERLNAVKERKLELVLDDKTRADIAQLEKKRLELVDNHAEQMRALQDRRNEINQEAAQKKIEMQQAAARAVADFERKKAQAEADIQEVGHEMQHGLGQALTAGERAIREAGQAIRMAIMRIVPKGGTAPTVEPPIVNNQIELQVEQPTINNPISMQIETSHLGTESTLRKILAAIQGSRQPVILDELQTSLSQAIQKLANRIASEISNLDLGKGGPGTPQPTPVNNYINLEVDTESLAKDATMEEILSILQGKFVNEE
jgi:hypothetical protein